MEKQIRLAHGWDYTRTGKDLKKQAEMVAIEEAWAHDKGVQASTARLCPSRLFGKRCRHFFNNFDECCCDQVHGWGDDHASLWTKDGKPYVYVSQPYSYNEEALKAWCEQYGLRYVVYGKDKSWWNPGETYLIEIYAE